MMRFLFALILIYGCKTQDPKQLNSEVKLRQVLTSANLLDMESYWRAKKQGAAWLTPVLSFRDFKEDLTSSALTDLKGLETDIKTVIDKKLILAEINSPLHKAGGVPRIMKWKNLKNNVITFDTLRIDDTEIRKTMQVKDLGYYQVITEGMLEALKKRRERFSFNVKGKPLQVRELLGIGGFGMVFASTFDNQSTVTKFLLSEGTEKDQSTVALRGNVAMTKLCKDSDCGPFVKIISVIMAENDATGKKRKTLIFERGEETVDKRLVELIRANNLEKLNEFLFELVTTAVEAFRILRANNVCHMDADISNFIVFPDGIRLGDFDVMASRDGIAFGLPNETGAKYNYIPPEYTFASFRCTEGFDPFYFAYSLVGKLSFFFRAIYKDINNRSSGRKATIDERKETYRSDVYPEFERMLNNYVYAVQAYLKKNFQADDRDPRIRKVGEVVRILRRMLSPYPTLRTIDG